MELIALRTFEAVVTEGGVLAASRKLHTVQSNVTGRIQKLEEELGAELFFRRGRSLELAPSGKVLLDYARRMLQLERQTAAAVRQAGESAGELRIGSMETFAALHLPTALKEVRHRHPKVELRIVTDTSASLAEKVLSHKLDCAFVAGPVDHQELSFDLVTIEELVQVHARDSDPTQLPLILFREGCAYRARAVTYQRMIGHPFADAMEFGTLEGILGCIAVGLGWTLMPRRVIENSSHARDLVINTVPSEIAHVPTGMISLRSSPALASLKTLRESFDQSRL